MELLPYTNKSIKSVMIKKIGYPTECQYAVKGEGIKVCYFKSYDQAVSYFFCECNLTKERHLQNHVIMEK